MTKEEAYNILDQVTAQVNATRETHNQIQLALNVIKDAIADKLVAIPPISAKES